MSTQDKIKSFLPSFPTVVAGAIGQVLFVAGAAIAGWLADLDDKWWLAVLSASILLNSFLVQWAMSTKRDANSVYRRMERQKEKMARMFDEGLEHVRTIKRGLIRPT